MKKKPEVAKLIALNPQFASRLLKRFNEMKLPEHGGEVMGDDFARYCFLRKGFILLVINTPKKKSMSLHPPPCPTKKSGLKLK